MLLEGYDLWTKFVFYYPLLMSIVWIIGSIIYYFKWEYKISDEIPEDIDSPLISILVPCYNEEDTVEETVEHLNKLSYPNKEIICVNDGSKDNTGPIIQRLSEEYDIVRAIDSKENKGKANALRLALFASHGEYLVCLDSDAILDDDAPYQLIKHFYLNGDKVGAVTGNPRIRNRSTLLGKLQVIEYASIIGAIKRTQRILGKVMTVSGVIVAFRKDALIEVGLWDTDMITEDIGVTWKLHEYHWDVRYEPYALCWMLVPEKLTSYWNQRVRWAQGGQEVIMKFYRLLLNFKYRRLWPIYIEQILSIFWAISFVILFLTYLLFGVDEIRDILIWFTFSGMLLFLISTIQLMISLLIDSKYDKIGPMYLFIGWYPFIYWIVNILIAIRALPKSIYARYKGGYATWSSPDRGNRVD